jgi:hypothetical protein
MAAGTPLTDEELRARVDVYNAAGRNGHEAARRLGIDPKSLRDSLKRAAERGLMLDHPPAMPGFRISQVTSDANGNPTSIQQKSEHGAEPYTAPLGQILDKVSVLLNPERGEIIKWEKYRTDDIAREAAMRAMVEGFKDQVQRAESVNAYTVGDADKVNQYTVTDYHFGMMAWGEETGGADSDLKLQEQLWCKWWAYAIAKSPEADTAILAQLGDLVHFDGMKAITPAHGHVLDSDSRFSKIVRVVIRCMRFAVRELLKKHQNVHLIFSDANHDEAGEVWLREMFAAHFEDEPRVTVDRSPGSFNVFEWGLTSLFYHHGHKKKFKDVDTTWVGRFREVFGRTKFSYGHTGHLHSDEMFTSNTGVKVERHETLAAPSTYEANAGYNSGRSAKVITYSKRFGQCGRIIITPEMVME